MDIILLIVAALMGTYVAIFGILRNINHWYYVSRLGARKYSLPPGDMGWPLLGNMIPVLKALKSTSFINNMANRYGHTGIYKTHLFGRPSIIVCQPKTCWSVLTDERFVLSYPGSAHKLGGRKSFHSVSREEHKRLRKLITSPINGHKSLAMYIGFIEDILVNALEEWASMDKPIEFLSEMKRTTFQVITHIFLGGSSNASDSVEKYYSDLLSGIMSLAINLPGFSFHTALKARRHLVEILQTVLDEKRAMNTSSEKKGMIDLMMEAEDDEGTKLDDEHIIDLLLLFLLAGHESTSHAGTWAIIFLHRHPDILKKAREEQEEILRRRPSTQKGLSLNEIRQMEYLSKVIDETLRTNTAPLFLFREAKDDVNIDGYLIPKGWKVLVSSGGVHMDHEIHFNPKEFLPSRWDNYIPKPGVFMPFGAGRRICPGADLAKLEIYIFLHYFLVKYKLEQLNPDGPWVYLPVPKPADNCVAKITKLQ